MFFWSRGADVRRRILKIVGERERDHQPCYLSYLAGQLGISHVAAKKHVDLLAEQRYLRVLNPNGKPLYLGLGDDGKKTFDELFKKNRKKA